MSDAAEIVARIRQDDAPWHSFLRLFDEPGFTTGRRKHLLDGMPIGIKDIFDVAGDVTGVGSPIYSSDKATADAVAVQQLRDAGALIIGKTRMTELAWSGWGINRLEPSPRNPRDPRDHRIAGGSSSGSAVAVAAGLVPAALGSDTGGSVRIPAAFCGVVGWKPRRDEISRTGMVVLSESLDAAGILAADMTVLKRVHAVLCCPIPDMEPGNRLKIGILGREQWITEDGMVPLLWTAIAHCASLGRPVDDIAMPLTFNDYAERAGMLVNAEAFRTIGRFALDETSDLAPEIRRDILAGAHVTRGELDDLRSARLAERQRFLDATEGCDLFLLPVTRSVAPRLEDLAVKMGAASDFTRLANYLDLAALSLPIGLAAEGLPVALQIMARPGAEPELFHLASTLERKLRQPAWGDDDDFPYGY